MTAELFAAALERASAVLVRVPVAGFEESQALCDQLRAWRAANPGHLEHIAHGARDYQEVDAELAEERGFSSFVRIDPFIECRFPIPSDPDAVTALLDAVLDLLPILAPYAWPDRPEFDLVPKGAEA